jgi:hypothetical protein
MQLLDILDLMRGLTLGCGDKATHHLPGMIGMSGRAGSNRTGKISGRHGISCGPTDTYHTVNTINYLARPHITILATGATGAEQTGRHAPTVNAVVGSADVLGQILVQQIPGGSDGNCITGAASVSFITHSVSSGINRM